MRYHAVLLLCLILPFASGCEEDCEIDHPDAGNNGTPTVTDLGSADVDNTGAAYASEYTTRLTTLEFTTVPASDLNGIIALNLDQSLAQPIIIIHRLHDIVVDADAGATAMLEAGSGLKSGTADEFTYDPESMPGSTAASLDPATGSFSGTFPLYRFVATIEFNNEVQRVDIPIRELTISGKLALSDDGMTATIPEGTWEGHITKADGDITMVKLVGGSDPRPLTELFREETLNFNASSGMEVPTGTGDAWLIRGQYQAAPAALSE